MDYERPGEESLFELQSYDAAYKEITRLAADKRLIFVIDEYPYLAKAYPAVSAMLQHIRETPAAEKSGKKTVYQLSDFFFRFWYRFVPKNTGAIESGRIKEIYQSAVKQHLSDYMGLVFEKMCRDYLIYYAQNLPIPLSLAGQWWGTDPKEKKEIQIDIVGVLAEGTEYIIGSCKYRNEKTGADELIRLKENAAVFGKGSRYYFYIFSKSGFTEGLLEAAAHEDVTLLTLDDIYN